jgi:hypothetical protein
MAEATRSSINHKPLQACNTLEFAEVREKILCAETDKD